MKEKKYETVYNDLLLKIKSNDYPAGSKLPYEADLCVAYGVSRITVVKALRMLKDINLIYSVKKGGTFVNGKTQSSAVPTIIPLIIPHRGEISAQFEKSAQDYGLLNNCFIQIYHTDNSVEKEGKILSEVLKMNIDGIMIYPCSDTENIHLLSEFMLRGTPIIFLDRLTEGIGSALITSDNKNGMCELVNYLLKLGHRKIGVIGINT